MNKRELIAYLDAVCAAETGILACNGAISVYQQELSQVTCSEEPWAPRRETAEPPAPVEKKTVYKPYKRNIVDYILHSLSWPFRLPGLSASEILKVVLGIMCYIYICTIIGFLLSFGMELDPSDPLLPFRTFVIFSYFPGSALFPFLLKKKEATEQKEYEAALLAAEQEYEAACKTRDEAYELSKADAENSYQRQMQVYNQSMERYRAELKVVTAARDAIRTRIRQQETFRSELQKRLEQLYAKDVLYPNFRSLIAAYQIREYLKMGMCEELTGPTGAYAVYMNDVRTARVCDSIHELQRNLVSAIGGLQSTLALELQSVQHQLGSLEQGLHANLQGISENMRTMHRDYQLGMDSTNHHLEQANQRLARIQSGTDSIAINQYMANLKAGASAYFPPV